MITVRAATPEDWTVRQQLYESVAAEGRWILGELPVDWDERKGPWLEAVADERFAVLLAEVDGEAVGWLTAEHLWSGRVEIGMGVLAGHRGVGIGKALMEAALDWARQRGAHKVELQLWPNNERALALYERFGFEIEGRFRRHWRRRNGELWDCIQMGLVLDEDSPGAPGDTM